MGKSRWDMIVSVIDDNLDHPHKQRWAERAAELHDEEHRSKGAAKEQARQALRDHYDVEFKPETSRAAFIEQAAVNYTAEHPEAAEPGPALARSALRSR